MNVDVKVPEVGESITEGVLVEWFKEDGDLVHADEPLFELETDKITLTVNAEQAGRLRAIAKPNDTVAVGQVVGMINTEANMEGEAPPAEEAPKARPQPKQDAEPPESVERPKADVPAKPAETPTSVPQQSGVRMNPPAGFPQAEAKLQAQAQSGEFSPAVRRMIEEFKLDTNKIVGSGKGGRITKEDVQNYLATLEPAAPPANGGREAMPTPALPTMPAHVHSTASQEQAAVRTNVEAGQDKRAKQDAVEPGETARSVQTTPRQTRRKMTRLRQRIAERLVLAQHEAAMLTTFNEVDMTKASAWRAAHKEAFEKKYGVRLGFMSFFVKAAVDALKTVPQVNAQIQGDEIVQNHFFDIGIAVGSDRGLVVPVLRDADQKSFADLERDIGGLAKKVRDKTITLSDLSGGVFTISNGGVYGSLMSTPILNPPQAAILGMHAIKKRPIVVDDEIKIRPMMYLALSYDHRLIDGGEAVTFLKRIVDCVENPERMLLEV